MTLTLGSSTDSPLYSEMDITSQCRTYAIVMIMLYAVDLIVIYIAYIQYKILIQLCGTLSVFFSVGIIALYYNAPICATKNSNGIEIYIFLVITIRIFIQTVVCMYVGMSNISTQNHNLIANAAYRQSNELTDEYADNDGQLLLLSQLQYSKLRVQCDEPFTNTKDIIITIDNTTLIQSLVDALHSNDMNIQSKAQQIAQSEALIDALQYMDTMQSSSNDNVNDSQYQYILALNPNGSYRVNQATSNSSGNSVVDESHHEYSTTVRPTHTSETSVHDTGNTAESVVTTHAPITIPDSTTQQPEWLVRQYPQLMVHQSGSALVVNQTITVAEQRIRSNSSHQRTNPYLSALIRAPIMYLNSTTSQNINLPNESGLGDISLTAPMSLQQQQIDQLQVHTVVMRNKPKNNTQSNNQLKSKSTGLPPLHNNTSRTVDIHYTRDNMPMIRAHEMKFNPRQLSGSSQLSIRNEMLSPLPVYSIHECKTSHDDSNHTNQSHVIDMTNTMMPWTSTVARDTSILDHTNVDIQLNHSPSTMQPSSPLAVNTSLAAQQPTLIQRSTTSLSNSGGVQLFLPRSSSYTTTATQLNETAIHNILARAISSPQHPLHNNNILSNVPSSPLQLSERSVSLSVAESIASQLQHDDENFYGCTICLTEYKSDDQVVHLPCIHSYHAICVQSWLKHKNSCPTCRLPVFVSIPTVYIH